jgi:glycosyltransferase involved in cell wall biosynthesis
MRIATVSPRFTPDLAGGSQVRVANVLGRIAERHDVRLFSQPRPHQLPATRSGFEQPHTSRAAAAFVELGERTWARGPVLSGAALRLTRPRALRDLLRWADVTVVEFPWQFGPCARLVGPRPLVLSAHNVEVERFVDCSRAAGRSPNGPWVRYVERMERQAVERADLVTAVSEADRCGLVDRYGLDPGRVVVAPNGADVEAILPADTARRAAARRALGLPDDRPVVLYAGADTTPNRHGLEWVRELARSTDRYTFLVVGRVGGRPRREGALVATGWVRDFPSYLAAADLAICPIQYGGGTKLKLIEFLAAGIPTVAFREALLGTHARDGDHLLVAGRSAGELRAALDRLSDDPELAQRLGASARTHAEERHDWRDTAAVVERALEKLAGEAGARAPRLSAALRG